MSATLSSGRRWFSESAAPGDILILEMDNGAIRLLVCWAVRFFEHPMQPLCKSVESVCCSLRHLYTAITY